MVNGVQPASHENGLPSKGDTAHFEEIIQLANQGNSSNGGREKSESDMPTEPILAFESDEPFLKKVGPMKPQHVAGTLTEGERGNSKGRFPGHRSCLVLD